MNTETAEQRRAGSSSRMMEGQRGDLIRVKRGDYHIVSDGTICALKATLEAPHHVSSATGSSERAFLPPAAFSVFKLKPKQHSHDSRVDYRYLACPHFHNSFYSVIIVFSLCHS